MLVLLVSRKSEGFITNEGAAVLYFKAYRCRGKWYFYTGVSRPDQQYPKKPEKRHAPYGRMYSHGSDKRQVYESYLLTSEAGSLMDTKGQVAFNLVKCASDKSHTLILGVYPYTGHETLPDLADAEMDVVRTLKDVIKIVDPVERFTAIKKYLKDTYGVELPPHIDSFDGVLNTSAGGAIDEQELIRFISAVNDGIYTWAELDRFVRSHQLTYAVKLATWLKEEVSRQRELIERCARMAISDFYYLYVQPRVQG
ncbi:unnamed protein product [Vitrella brassicaformis CCMP3155]|uniref:Uncharacterized protein n=1 Tax=Vitrella brassicaformis (strain CCMP3155) TaxID=1169540 RepID=A0A0G4GYK9_VITBC|nr:unnamed protein product [Vitrella brassicaformis CCMP3155]|eukprot:CEM36219.1 unnamed protein product [Vitrella brassicaformis CCMP3155]